MILTATSPVPQVTAQVPVAQEYLVRSGDQVTVTMTVRLAHQNQAVHFDQAPVSVNIVSARASHVLAVPLSALMALSGGGYAVQVTQGSGAHASTRLVPVQIGLFDDTLVQVSGPGLAVGMRVGVPSA